ncbi:MAG: DUF2865 domain-containing protein [Proteobacteria bacterium]|nr:DUF2865 domain-containing protein [Pseudomonadota bacterium]
MIFAAAALAIPLLLVPGIASAEGLLDFFFGGASRQQQQSPAVSAFADPSGLNQPQPAAPKPPTSSGRTAAFCVRTCDGRYFPLLARGGSTPAQMCQAFCPASPTKVFSGSSIDSATTSSGERYADSDNAYAYRKALKAGCTCNGRDPAGLAPIDLSLDTSLRSGDVIATSTGLVAYSGIRVGTDQTAEFTPIADFPGLTASVRARLGEMKVAPVTAEMIPDDMPVSREANLPRARKTASPSGKHVVN